MSTDTAINKVKVVLDTNILISAIAFGGKPRQILKLVLDKDIQAISSVVLLAEFEDIVFKKFPPLANQFKKIEKQIRKNFKIVKPKKNLHILKDEPDNRVLEAGWEGKCEFIITGDKELLALKAFKNLKIITADQFLKIYKG